MGAPTGELARGLYFYHARYYDPALGRFIQPDTIVPNPGDPQALNRYSYAANNPVRYMDPSGHRYTECGPDGTECSEPIRQGGGPGTPTLLPPPTPLPWGWPTSTPTATPGPQWQSPFTPTPASYLNPATPWPTPTPTATPIPLGEINIPDTYWTLSTWLTYELPEALLGEGGPTAIRAGGRAAGNLNPAIEVIGWGASVGPNLVDHLASGDSGTDIVTDLIVDTGGWGLSFVGSQVGMFVGGTVGEAIQPEGGGVPGAIGGNLVGSLATSMYYDVKIAPRIRPHVHNIVDNVFGQ